MIDSEAIWRADVQQRIFRELLEAFSRPGNVCDLAAWTDDAAAQRGVLATLMDGESTLADPHGLIDGREWPLLQARREVPETARYVVADGRRAPDFQPALGSLESPEFGATLLIKVGSVGTGDDCVSLTGPGIKESTELRYSGLHPEWLERRGEWISSFPLGVDMLLLDATHIVALPRTTRVIEMKGSAR